MINNLVDKGEPVYVMVDKKTKVIIGVYGGIYEANRVLEELGGTDKIRIEKRLLGYDIYH